MSSSEDPLPAHSTLLSKSSSDYHMSPSYSSRMKMIERKSRCRWLLLVIVCVVILLTLVGGAVLILWKYGFIMHAEDEAPQRSFEIKDDMVYKFDYLTDDKKEEVVINTRMNFTEMFAEDLTVYNHFSNMVTFHLVEIAPGISVCLVKSIENEIPPKELEERLPKLTEHISVKSTVTLSVHREPVDSKVFEDIRVHQFCRNARVYTLKPEAQTDANSTLTLEELVTEAQAEYSDRLRKRSYEPSNDRDRHDSPSYHCGGPIGAGRSGAVRAVQYSCTKSRKYCYSNLVSERCEECYHGHNLRTSGCWCPIQAINTCIKISSSPDIRQCCGPDVRPCIEDECEPRKIPYIPIPEITFRVISHR